MALVVSVAKRRCTNCKKLALNYGDGGVNFFCSENCRLEYQRKPKFGRRVGSIPSKIRDEVYHRDARRCRGCGVQTNLQAHHIKYRSEGGKHVVGNLITLCGMCHETVHSNKQLYQPICELIVQSGDGSLSIRKVLYEMEKFGNL